MNVGNRGISVSSSSRTVLQIGTFLPVRKNCLDRLNGSAVVKPLDSHGNQHRIIFSPGVDLPAVELAQIKPTPCRPTGIFLGIGHKHRDPLTGGDVLYLDGIDHRVMDLLGGGLCCRLRNHTQLDAFVGETHLGTIGSGGT